MQTSSVVSLLRERAGLQPDDLAGGSAPATCDVQFRHPQFTLDD